MKVLYIVNVLADDANPHAEPFVKAQIDSARRAGIDISILNIRGNESKLNYLHAIYRLHAILRKKNFDIIHGHYVYSGWIATLQKKVPSIVSFMGSDLYGSPKSDGSLELQGYFDIILSRFLQYYVEGIIVKSKNMEKWIIKKDKVIVLPNGVDFNVFKEIPRTEACRKLGLNPEKKYVLFAGNYKIPRKAFWVVRDAVQILKEEDADVELLRTSRVAHNLIPYYMNASNVLALASLNEGSPNVVKEAMACNLPIVSTDVGDVKEIIGNVRRCFIVKRDPKIFAEKIREILLNVDKTEGRRKIKHLRIEKIAEKLIHFYKHILNSCS